MPTSKGAPQAQPEPVGQFTAGGLEALMDNLPHLLDAARSGGDLILLTNGPPRVWVCNHPDVARAALHSPYLQPKRAAHPFFKRVFGHSFLYLQGTEWTERRRVFAPAFRSEVIPEYNAIVPRETARMISSWPSGEPIWLNRAMFKLHFQISAQTLIGIPQGSALDHLASLFDRALMEPEDAPIPEGEFYELWDEIDSVVFRWIDSLPSSLPPLMRRIAKTSPVPDRTQVRDDIVTFLMGATGSPTAQTVFALYFLVHLGLQGRLAAEALVGPSKHNSMGWPVAFVHEVLRLYPVSFGFTREVQSPVTISGIALDPGDVVLASTYLAHRDSRYYTDPLTFRPERWLDGSLNGLPRLAFLPFGGGPHNCMGANVALQRIPTILSSMARSVTFAEIPDRPWALPTALRHDAAQQLFLVAQPLLTSE